MNLEKDRKILIVIPHSDDELLSSLSVINRHPNKNNIYSITLVNEPILQNFINKHSQELAYGTNQINKFFSSFGVKENHNFRVHKTLDIISHCFNIVSLINPDEVYCPGGLDGHDDHQLFYNVFKTFKKKLGLKMFNYLIHIPDDRRPKPDYVIKLTEDEIKLKEALRLKIYPFKVDVPDFMKERFGEREEFYND